MRKVSLIILALGLGAATAAHAANPVRISQVYGGGAGGAYRCDYVELFNDSEAPVDIGGWSIQYGSAGGSSFASATYNWAKIPSGATVPACGYYLVRGYCGTDGAELPVTPDLVPASGWSFNLSGVAGKVALFRDQVTGRTCASAQASSQLVDLVGYGGANCYETAPAPELDVASVLARASGGAVDSDDNSTDFARVPASAVTVHNSAGAPNPECRLGSAPPDVPVLAAPLDGATGTVAPVTLEVTVSDPEADELSVSFHGRPVVPWPQGEEFSLVLLPDTENYTAYSNGGKNAMFVAQTQWVVGNLAARNLAARNIAARNIAAVAHLGDITSSDSRTQYVRADSAMRLLEDPETTGLADGVPYVMIRGNSDGSSNFNDYWGVSRFAGRGYYGGHYGSGNDHSYILFSAAGRDFILVALSFDPSSAALEWAHGVLAAHPGRLGIVVSHSVLNPGNPASWTSEGYPIYSALRDLPNLLLLLCGHMNGEGRRRDVHAGVVVHSLLTDYQLYPGGGNGWLRILEFVPAANKVRARTYSPWLDQWSAGPDSSSQFTLDVPLGGVSQPDYALLGTVTGVPSGANAVLPWSGLAPGTQHEWYVEVGDGRTRRTGPPWSFTTGASSSTGAGEEPRGGLALAPPAPNPARGSLRFAFDLPRAMHARLSVLDVQGRVVAVLAEGGFAAGQHERAWDATAAARADAGLYFVRLETPEGTRVRRVAVVR